MIIFNLTKYEDLLEAFKDREAHIKRLEKKLVSLNNAQDIINCTDYAMSKYKKIKKLLEQNNGK